MGLQRSGRLGHAQPSRVRGRPATRTRSQRGRASQRKGSPLGLVAQQPAWQGAASWYQLSAETARTGALCHGWGILGHRRRLAGLRSRVAGVRELDLAPAPSCFPLRSLVANAALIDQLRPIIRRQRKVEVRKVKRRADAKAKRALPWAKQQKPAKSSPPKPWVEKPWCQACDRYHVEGKHGPKRAK